MTILAVDPGASSGWYIPGAIVYPLPYGTIKLANKDAAQSIENVVRAAVTAGARVCVIEGPVPMGPKAGWRTMYGLGVARGRWEQEARRQGLEVVEVNPRTWQAACIGGRCKREEGILLYRARAKSIVKSAAPIQADAAAAVCIGEWWERELALAVRRGKGR